MGAQSRGLYALIGVRCDNRTRRLVTKQEAEKAERTGESHNHRSTNPPQAPAGVNDRRVFTTEVLTL